MGCGGSKLDDLEAVALCRDRTRLLADAIRHRYALADAHAAYAASLRATGASLHRFLDAIRGLPEPSPHLPLPAQRKGDPFPPPSLSPPPPSASLKHAHSHSHSHSGSHIQFHSSDSDSDSDSHLHLHSTGSSPIHHLGDEHPGPSYNTTSYNFNYARSNPAAPSVSYEHRPQSPETVRFSGGGGGGGGEGPASYLGYQYPAQSSGLYPYQYSYQPNYSDGGGYYGGYGSPPSKVPAYSAPGDGFFGGYGSPPPRSVPAYASVGGVRGASPSRSRPPPPPPSPPRISTWDFLDPFQAGDNYEENIRYAPYTPSRSSREVREEEGIPDLEDEEHEVVKEVYSDQKFVPSSSSSSSRELPSKAAGKDKEVSEAGDDLHYKPRRSAEASTSTTDYGANVVDKNVVTDEGKQPEEEPQQNVGAVAVPRKYNDAVKVVQEIKAQFDKASGSFDEVSKMLEVGKIPYHQKNYVYRVPTGFMCGMASLSTSKNELLELEDASGMDSMSLSSTLQKLYMWEQKLYDEIKVEEKMRVTLERQCERLRHLDERGAESHKLEATQALIRKLSTKIRIAIQVVESIANKINRLRDEELWPQISELIQGLMRMWRIMLESHRTQYQAISEATIASDGRLTDAHMEMTKRLELELLDLIACFSAWVSSQKNFVKSLNEWLIKGLHYVPEETADGFVPFSPGRLGAPPVFVICNYWSQSINRISEKEVVDALQTFASNVLGLWEQHKFEQRQRLMANKDMDTSLRTLEREEQEMRKALESQNKKLVLVSRQSGLTLSQQAPHGHTAELSSLQLNLRQIFEAMESFTSTSVKTYEELRMRSEEEKLEKENSEVS